ncbi:MAG: peroxidase-related enzyme [Cohaesibacter sp.]|nr:peroxidase-related enzyme [Cohaesibacter sp.]
MGQNEQKDPVKQGNRAVIALDLPAMDPMPADIAKYLAICQEKLGLVPNVLSAHAFSEDKFRAFSGLYNALMLEESGLSKLEREMIAVVVSSVNRCFYCLVAHGQAVRELSGDPQLGEMLVMNYRVADLSNRHRVMLDYAAKLTEKPSKVVEDDREALREAGFSDHDIWDIANVVGFFNMSNRVAIATDMMPNEAYHGMDR